MLDLHVVFQERSYAILSPGEGSIPLTIEEGKTIQAITIYPIFYTEDIDHSYQKLSEKGVNVTEIVQKGANTYFDLFDPDGNKMQVCYY